MLWVPGRRVRGGWRCWLRTRLTFPGPGWCPVARMTPLCIRCYYLTQNSGWAAPGGTWKPRGGGRGDVSIRHSDMPENCSRGWWWREHPRVQILQQVRPHYCFLGKNRSCCGTVDLMREIIITKWPGLCFPWFWEECASSLPV